MVTLDDYNNINDVLFLLKKDVYFNEEDLLLDNNQVLDSELLTYSVVNNRGEVGEVLEVFFASETNKIIRVKFNKEYLIPYNSPMIKEINKNKKELVIELLEGME